MNTTRSVSPCISCGNAGYGLGLKNRHGVWVDPRRPAKIPGPLYVTLIPCTCMAYNPPAGEKGVFPLPVRQALTRYIIAPVGPPASKEDDRDMSTVREFQAACEENSSATAKAGR